MNIGEVKRQIIDAGLSAYSRGLVGAAGGNISMRLGDRYFITATNAPLRSLKPEDILEIDINGNVVGENYGGRKPSKEYPLHLEVFRNRPDIDSVIHVHPVYSIACSLVFPGVFPIYTVSAINKIGKVAHISFAQAGSKELVDGARKAIAENDSRMKTVIMERHGIIAFDSGMEKCYERTELVEETAKIGLLAAMGRAAQLLIKKEQD